ncbi:MAG TPA: chorismate-binding protein, partial [Actinomycetota bacterium]|nr:chorismate-binding protein [Actinomycetota bacterium]
MPAWQEPVHLICEQIPTDLPREDVLRSFRGDEDLVVLAGEWAGGGALVASDPQHRASARDDPFLTMTTMPKVIGQVPGAIGGGWFGYLGYQLGGNIEQLPDPPPRPTALPAFGLSYYDSLLRYDGTNDQWWFEALWSQDRAPVLERRLATIRTRLFGDPEPPRRYTCTQFLACPDAARHREAVERCIEYIWAGDIYQANICMRLEADFTGDPFELYLSGLLRLDPARSAYISGPWGAVASFSPELFLHRVGRQVRSAPIKGTGRRSSRPQDDEKQRAALEASEKDRAENVMIVDLMRNDLGRVCAAGSVSVPSLISAEDHPGLWHLVSVVTGQLHDGSDDT